MLPTPFKDFLPEDLKYDDSEPGTALCNKMDSTIQAWLTDIMGLGEVYNPLKTQFSTLEELGYFIGAGIISTDSEINKRFKISTAIQRQKNAALWELDLKLIVDSYCGGGASVLAKEPEFQRWIMGGYETITDEIWFSMGYDGIGELYGMYLGGELSGSIGDILINVDNSTLTTDQVNELVTKIKEDSDFAYFVITLGYISGTTFVPYITY